MRSFAKILLATTALAIVSGAASAADMARRMPTKAPVMVPGYNWTGLYLGVHGGYGWASLGAAGFGRSNQDGGFLGGQIGYNWQGSGSPFVLGVELDSAWANLRQSATTTIGAVTGAATSKVDYLGSARVRAGFAADRALFYGTVGLGWASNELTSAAAFPAFAAGSRIRNTHVGVAAGAGIEYAFAGPWSAKAEYMYYGLGRESYAGVNADLDIHTIKVGLNYRFGQPW
ncbi:MAG: porin family protein [Pseudolabrys sp.]|nr:porin family protein [Pseudolabrys sp.]MBV9955089.1 porin family protein [Pseudolabrys sp.]